MSFPVKQTMPEIIFPVKYGYMPDSKGISVKSGKLVRSLKDIKSSQLKPGYAVWGRVLKELDLGLPRKVNGDFLIRVGAEQQIRAAFGRVPTGQI